MFFGGLLASGVWTCFGGTYGTCCGILWRRGRRWRPFLWSSKRAAATWRHPRRRTRWVACHRRSTQRRRRNGRPACSSASRGSAAVGVPNLPKHSPSQHDIFQWRAHSSSLRHIIDSWGWRGRNKCRYSLSAKIRWGFLGKFIRALLENN